MVQTMRMLGDAKDALSLGQGGTRTHAVVLEPGLGYQAPHKTCRGQQLIQVNHAGAVYWGPFEQAVRKAAEHALEPEFYSYGFDHGIGPLREALVKKISEKNGLEGVSCHLFLCTDS